MMTRTGIEAFIDLYLGISPVPFGPEHLDRARIVTDQRMGADGDLGSYEAYLDFAETQFNHRVVELAQVARQVARVPDFHFYFSNAGTFDAQAVTQLDMPLVRLDASLYTFWILIALLVVWIDGGTDDHAERLALNDVLWSTIAGYSEHRKLPETDKHFFDTWLQRDQAQNGAAVALATVIAYFVILHEMMHLAAPEGLPPHALEYEMDRRAADALVRLRATPDLAWATVPSGALAAPVLFFEIQHMVRLHRGTARHTDPAHPPPRMRRQRLERYVYCQDNHDQGVYHALRHTCRWVAWSRPERAR